MTTFTDFLLTSESSSNYVCSCCYTRWHHHTWHRCASSCRLDVLKVCRCNWSLLHWNCSGSVTHSKLLFSRSYVWAASAAVMTLLLGRVDTNWYCNWLKLRSQLFQVSLVLFVVYSVYNLSVLIKYLWSKTVKLGIVSVWVLSYYWVVKSMLLIHIVSVNDCAMEVTEWNEALH